LLNVLEIHALEKTGPRTEVNANEEEEEQEVTRKKSQLKEEKKRIQKTICITSFFLSWQHIFMKNFYDFVK
jgi:hypothetical protein